MNLQVSCPRVNLGIAFNLLCSSSPLLFVVTVSDVGMQIGIRNVAVELQGDVAVTNAMLWISASFFTQC